MKLALALLALVIAAPAEAKVGRPGDCPQNKDGYCETAREWWDQKMLSQ
jgi:hypothetical protein